MCSGHGTFRHRVAVLWEPSLDVACPTATASHWQPGGPLEQLRQELAVVVKSDWYDQGVLAELCDRRGCVLPIRTVGCQTSWPEGQIVSRMGTIKEKTKQKNQKRKTENEKRKTKNEKRKREKTPRPWPSNPSPKTAASSKNHKAYSPDVT